MWCQHCQQDVPAVSEPGSCVPACSRCRRHFDSNRPAPDRRASVSPADAAQAEPLDPVAKLSDWDTQQRLRVLARTLRRSHSATPGSAISTNHLRFEPPQRWGEPAEQQLAGRAEPTAAGQVPSRPSAPSNRNAGSQFMSWAIVFLGVVVFSCSVGLGIQSLLQDIPVYWELAIGLALVGQALLILGLVMVLSWLWRNSRYATRKLHEVHWQLNEVQRTAQTIAGLRNNSAPAFYAELARGASPQLLLASLRGQLEQLSSRLDN